MKKFRLLSSIALGVGCLLGVGGISIATNLKSSNLKEAKADASTLFSCDFKNERSKLLNNVEFDHPMTYGGSNYTGDNYDTGTVNYWDSLTVTYLNPSQSIVSSISFPTFFYKTSTYSQDTFTMKIEVYVGGEKVKWQQINNFYEYNPTGSYFFYKTTGSNVVDGLESYTQNGGSIAFKFISDKTSRTYGFSGSTDPTVLTVYGYASHDVTLNNGSGTGPTSVKMVDGYPLYSLDSIPTIDNGTFTGYYDAATGGTKYYNADGTAALSQGDSTTTLYAHWDMNGTTITLNKQGGTGGSDSALGVKDSTLPAITVPTKSGYTFNGYFEQENGQGTQYYNTNGSSSYTWTSEAASATIYASWTIKPEVQNAIDKINAIGDVSYPGSGDKITAARSAYDTVGASDQAGVSNYSTLTAAETEYENQKTAGVNNVITLINAIGEVELTDASKAKIDAARSAYNTLTSEQKALVTNYNTLTAAEDRYAVLEAAKEAADPVNDLIAAIGEVSYPGSKAKIDAARAAYNTLTTDDQRSFVNIAVLEAAESTYASLRTNAINNVETLISSIGEVTYPDSKDEIDAARSAYDALYEADKASVTNYSTLTTAEATYKTLEDDAKAKEVIALINDIGTVEYTATSKAKIDAARTAYDALSVEAKALVTNYSSLTNAEAEYKSLGDIEAVKTLINNIGTVEYTDVCKAKIDAANTAYLALNETQKDAVSNKKVLFDAIELYNTLKHQPEVNENGVDVKGKDGELIPVNVNIKVEVKTTVQAQEGSVEYEKIQNMLASNEKISGVYDVKLVRTIDGVETVIQPSDIKEGMVIIVEITLPDGLNVEGLKILHIHSENDITFVENFTINGNKVTFETDRLSEFAFVTQKANVNTGLPGWAIALIVIGGLLVLCSLCFLIMFLCFPRYIVDHNKKKVIRVIKVRKHFNEVLLFDTKLKKVRRNEVDVFKTRKEAEEALK